MRTSSLVSSKGAVVFVEPFTTKVNWRDLSSYKGVMRFRVSFPQSAQAEEAANPSLSMLESFFYKLSSNFLSEEDARRQSLVFGHIDVPSFIGSVRVSLNRLAGLELFKPSEFTSVLAGHPNICALEDSGENVVSIYSRNPRKAISLYTSLLSHLLDVVRGGLALPGQSISIEYFKTAQRFLNLLLLCDVVANFSRKLEQSGRTLLVANIAYEEELKPPLSKLLDVVEETSKETNENSPTILHIPVFGRLLHIGSQLLSHLGGLRQQLLNRD